MKAFYLVIVALSMVGALVIGCSSNSSGGTGAAASSFKLPTIQP